MKMIGNVSDWLSYAGGALIKVADSAGSTVYMSLCVTKPTIWMYDQLRHKLACTVTEAG